MSNVLLNSSAAYDRIAGEYYHDQHKTCRNFDRTTVAALAAQNLVIPKRGRVLDVGCGKGSVGVYLGIKASRVVQLDSSVQMLALQPREECLLQVLHRAESLPFLDAQFSCVAAFLCDPYFGLNFLAEASRVLEPSGLFIATTPAKEWGEPLRLAIEIDSCETRFKTIAGSEVRVPSTLVSRDRIAEMLVHVGFEAINVIPFRLPADVQPVSQDIIAVADKLKCKPTEIDLLYLIAATKE
jgi:SAM-dependent methyltransferase